MVLSFLQILFLVNAVVILGAAVCSVTVRNLVHAALWMVLSFFSVAILFVFLGTGFFAVIQVVIYIGAIAVLIMFAIMLTRREMQEKEVLRVRFIWLGGLAMISLFGILFFVLQLVPGIQTVIPVQANDELVKSLGLALVEPGQFGLVFELASLLLLVALIGAIYLARDRKSGTGGKQ
jgi:NADH-quinone oxidoreductase subunit J